MVRSGVTTIDDIGGSLENLHAAGGKVVGTVLTGAAVPRRTKAATIAYYEKVGDTTRPRRPMTSRLPPDMLGALTARNLAPRYVTAAALVLGCFTVGVFAVSNTT